MRNMDNRNECKYGDGQESMNKEKQRLRPTVEKMYNTYQGKVSTKDEQLFHQRIEDRMRKHPRMIKKWIMIVRTCMKQYEKEQKAGSRRQRRRTSHFYRMRKVQLSQESEDEFEANENSIEVEILPDRRHRDTG